MEFGVSGHAEFIFEMILSRGVSYIQRSEIRFATQIAKKNWLHFSICACQPCAGSMGKGSLIVCNAPNVAYALRRLTRMLVKVLVWI